MYTDCLRKDYFITKIIILIAALIEVKNNATFNGFQEDTKTCTYA